LRAAGWKVVRIWEHDLKAEPNEMHQEDHGYDRTGEGLRMADRFACTQDPCMYPAGGPPFRFRLRLVQSQSRIEKKPLQSIGLSTGALVASIYWGSRRRRMSSQSEGQELPVRMSGATMEVCATRANNPSAQNVRQ